MALQILQLGTTVQVVQRQTDPLIQCILDNKENKLKQLLRGIGVNRKFSSALLNDDVTLLSAAVALGHENIINFLLKQHADPNISSTNGLTSLHYAAYTKGISLNIVNRLLAAKADPDGHPQQVLSPLQFAACNDRLDIVKALIESGACIELNYGKNKDVDSKVKNIILQLPSENQKMETCKMFFNFAVAVRRKSQLEVFNLFSENFLDEHPFTHLVLFEQYFTVQGPLAEQYREISIKWLKESTNRDLYIEGFIKRFHRIPQKHWISALNSFHAVIRMVREVSSQLFNEIVPIFTKCVQPTGSTQGDLFNPLTLRILCVVMDKSSKKKPSADGLDNSILRKLCISLKHLTKPQCSQEISILTYCLFASLYELIPEYIHSCGLDLVPDKVLLAAEIMTEDVIKEKLQTLDTKLRRPKDLRTLDSSTDGIHCQSSKSKKKKKKKKKKDDQEELSSNNNDERESKEKVDPCTFKTSVEESNSIVQPFELHTEKAMPRKWHSVSQRWKPKLEKLANLEESNIYRLRSLTIAVGPEFKIAKGSDGTEVYLGLRDDGTEVAVKRMLKSNYQDLKNEEAFLRLPQLDDPCIVRYVDFVEDDNFGYLVLQLCEYTLEEYIQHHLPRDHSQQLDVLRKIIKEVLYSLKVLHDPKIKVLHRDIKPQNVLIDITGKARLADFGISRRLSLEQTTLRTGPAGTKCWKARETLEEESNSGYKRSSDIQVAGMLVYYILSRGHHPFGKGLICELNIFNGKYSLEHVEDEVANDLVEWMINHDPRDRPKVEDTLVHPFFWTDEKKVEYLRKLGNTKEVENCRNADSELLQAVENITVGKTFSDWKAKLPSEIVQKVDDKKKPYPNNLLGLLRFIRILQEHYSDYAEEVNLMTLFPDLFRTVFKFAKKKGWNARPALRKWLSSLSVIQ
ncbi:uncharacterized protein LOC134311535 [Trichomycterus rosablanca]|uniref:uncharacterized protein LOC134311535 n=1 Tax=Trichomycterus rosablanca TaxID=2290929 RepID=UPI002F35C5DB